MTNLEEIKESIEEVKEHLVLVRAGIPYVGVNEEFMTKTGFHLDGDLFAMSENGMRVLSLNHSRFSSEENFIEDKESRTVDETVVQKLNDYLSSKGKIPEYLKLKLGEDSIKVTTTKSISSNTFLGFYEGLSRPLTFSKKNTCRTLVDFEKKEVACVDCDNIEFSNWTRYVSTNENGNCVFVSYNYTILLFSNKTIEAGELLTSVN